MQTATFCSTLAVIVDSSNKIPRLGHCQMPTTIYVLRTVLAPFWMQIWAHPTLPLPWRHLAHLSSWVCKLVTSPTSPLILTLQRNMRICDLYKKNTNLNWKKKYQDYLVKIKRLFLVLRPWLPCLIPFNICFPCHPFPSPLTYFPWPQRIGGFCNSLKLIEHFLPGDRLADKWPCVWGLIFVWLDSQWPLLFLKAFLLILRKFHMCMQCTSAMFTHTPRPDSSQTV